MGKNNYYRYSDSCYHRGINDRRGYQAGKPGTARRAAASNVRRGDQRTAQRNAPRTVHTGTVKRSPGNAKARGRTVTRGKFTVDTRFIVRAAGMLLAAVMLFSAGSSAIKLIAHLRYPRRYEQIVTENCRRFGVDESFVYAVIKTESGFDPKAQSSVGAIGLMQIMPDTFRWLRTKLPAEGVYGSGEYTDEEMLLDPEINIRYGVYLLSVLRSEFGSDTLAAAAYHAGIGKVRQWVSSGTLAAESGYGDIPSGVTSHYVYKVEKARKAYADLYYG